jgi:predicted Zn-dependent protease
MADATRRTCPTCGSLNDEAALICVTCGENFAESDDFLPEVAEQHDVEPTMAAPPPQPAASPAPSAQQKESSPSQQVRASTPSHRGTKKVLRPQQQPQKARQSASRGGIFFTYGQLMAIGVALLVLITSIVLYYEQRTAAPVTEAAVAQQQAPTGNLGEVERQRAYVDANPDDMEATLALANAMHDAKLTDQAIVYYKKYLLKNPTNPDARVDLGICYFELGDHDTAIEEMTLAVKDNPTHQLGHFNLGIVTMAAKRMDESKAWFEKTIAINATSQAGQNAQRYLQENFK